MSAVDTQHLARALRAAADALDPVPAGPRTGGTVAALRCGPTRHGFDCALSFGHNAGHADIPENHQAAEPHTGDVGQFAPSNFATPGEARAWQELAEARRLIARLQADRDSWRSVAELFRSATANLPDVQSRADNLAKSLSSMRRRLDEARAEVAELRQRLEQAASGVGEPCGEPLAQTPGWSPCGAPAGHRGFHRHTDWSSRVYRAWRVAGLFGGDAPAPASWSEAAAAIHTADAYDEVMGALRAVVGYCRTAGPSNGPGWPTDILNVIKDAIPSGSVYADLFDGKAPETALSATESAETAPAGTPEHPPAVSGGTQAVLAVVKAAREWRAVFRQKPPVTSKAKALIAAVDALDDRVTLSDRFLADVRQAGWTEGVRWAAAEADAQIRSHDMAMSGHVLDITDHLRLCATDPARGTAVDRTAAPEAWS